MNYTIKSETLCVIVSTKGGEMQSIQTYDGTEYLWQGDANTWLDHAPNLFPYIGRLHNQRYQYQGKQYSLNIHGFLPYEEMELKSKEINRIIFKISDTEKLRALYPFRFEYLLSYEVKGHTITITSEIHNHDNKTMYFGLGGHPGFNVPLEPNLQFEDYILEFGSISYPNRIEFSETCFVTGKTVPYTLKHNIQLPLTHTLFDDDAIVLQNIAKEVTLKSPKGSKAVKVTFPQMEYIGFWHWPKSTVNYVCIEPWSSLPARVNVIENLETQENLIALDAGSVYTNTWKIEIIE